MLTYDGRPLRWDVPGEVIATLLNIVTEVEQARPIVEAALAVAGAKSGAQHALALLNMIDAVRDAAKGRAS